MINPFTRSKKMYHIGRSLKICGTVHIVGKYAIMSRCVYKMNLLGYRDLSGQGSSLMVVHLTCRQEVAGSILALGKWLFLTSDYKNKYGLISKWVGRTHWAHIDISPSFNTSKEKQQHVTKEQFVEKWSFFYCQLNFKSCGQIA